MDRILVIGSEGNIGRRLVSYLSNYEVNRCDQIQGTGFDYSVVNIMDYGDLSNVFDKFNPDIVFHLAAMVSRVTCEKSPCLTVNTNITGLNNVVELCKRHNSKLVYFSTSEVYGNIGGLLSEDRKCEPNNLYGLTKHLGEMIVQYQAKNGLRYVIVRPFMFYDERETTGDHRSAMVRFFTDLSMGKKITVHKGSKRSWMYTGDALPILEKLMYVENEVVNIGSPDVIETSELARKICHLLDVDYDEFVEEKELPEKMTLDKIPDISKQTTLTGIIPTTSIDEGLSMFL